MRKRQPQKKDPQKSLRDLLKEGSRRHAARSRRLAEEWFPLEEEVADRRDRETSASRMN